MTSRVERWAAAHWWRLSGRVARNRRELYGGAAGLRIVTFHDTGPMELAQLRRLVEWARPRFAMASPADVDALTEGRFPPGGLDRLLLTFDDGLASNFEAARWLAGVGVRAIFFVVPSLLDRHVAEYLRHHDERGVRAFRLGPDRARGLSSGQVREMVAMGHRVGAHNFAHRDLGTLHDVADLEYEVARALDAVSERTGAECQDFAIAFGQPHNVSDEAAAYLLQRCLRVYACHRGLNVPGTTPRFLTRDHCQADHPFAFTRLCVEGGADHHLADRARDMVRRVGVLPPAAGDVPASRAVR